MKNIYDISEAKDFIQQDIYRYLDEFRVKPKFNIKVRQDPIDESKLIVDIDEYE